MRNPQIRNPSGFLIAAVLLCFEGESFRIFRRGREEARRFEQAENERIAQLILDNPESDEESSEWAKTILGPTWRL